MFDVIVVGGGNAGLSAAHAAAGRGRRVLVVDAAPPEFRGGNSYFTAGATRIAHDGLDSLRDLIEPDERHERTEVPPYPRDEYVADMERVTGGRNDPVLTRILADESHDALSWLASLGIRYRLMYERQSYQRADGSYLFWGGLHVGNVGGGEGLIADHTRVALAEGVELRSGQRVVDLLRDGARVSGVEVELADGTRERIAAESVVLAAGGFEADPELREQHLGTGWRNAKVRGTPYNRGDLLTIALAHGAARGGDWSTCHSVAWDARTPQNESNRALTNRLTRQSYPLGIVVNRDGERFVDEGADFRNYTYAKYGREILAQPGSIAFQIFDATLRPLLRAEEYEMPGVSVVEADDPRTLAERAGIDPDGFERTVSEFNASITRSVAFEPNVLDGRRADLPLPKSNWASPIETAPLYAYPVTCGITFTFGGLRSDPEARVLGVDGAPIPGLYVCGEMLGGLFSGNYPGGSGLAAGVVFGRRAGSRA